MKQKEATFEQEKIAYEQKIEQLYNTIGQLTVDVNWLKKNLNKFLNQDGRKELVTRDDSALSISRQCRLLEMNRSSMYYQRQDATAREIELKHLMDRIHTDHPSWGTRRISVHLIKQGYFVGRKLVRRDMQEMRIYAILLLIDQIKYGLLILPISPWAEALCILLLSLIGLLVT